MPRDGWPSKPTLFLSQGAIPLWAGVLITALDAFLLLLIERFGVQNLEALFRVLIAVIAGSFGIMCSLAGVRALDVAEGEFNLSLELSCVRWSMLVCVQCVSQVGIPESIINIVLHDAIAIAHNGCSYGWAAQVLKCFAEHGKSSPLVVGAPVEVQPDELQLSFQMQRQAAFDAMPLNPRSCPGPGVKLCTYRRWFSRLAHQVCPVYWEVPMSTAKLQRILRFRMGSHLLPIEQGRHLRLPRHRRVCRLCHTGALGALGHMLLECPALADLRDEYSPFVAECSGVMARLVWARNQPMVSRYIIACLDRMSC